MKTANLFTTIEGQSKNKNMKIERCDESLYKVNGTECKYNFCVCKSFDALIGANIPIICEETEIRYIKFFKDSEGKYFRFTTSNMLNDLLDEYYVTKIDDESINKSNDYVKIVFEDYFDNQSSRAIITFDKPMDELVIGDKILLPSEYGGIHARPSFVEVYIHKIESTKRLDKFTFSRDKVPNKDSNMYNIEFHKDKRGDYAYIIWERYRYNIVDKQ